VLVDFLRANADVFAWSPSDMPDIPRDVAKHSLNIRAGADPSGSLCADSMRRSAEP
jgi:hypothetical protein